MQKPLLGTAVAVAVVLMMTSVLALLQSSRTITSSGTIKAINVGVYQDAGCTQTLTSISWGALDPGSSTNQTVYVKNEGNTAMVLNMTTNTWSPSNSTGYMTFTWNRENATVTPGNNVQASLVLSVSNNITGITNFSFNIVITGTA